MRKKTDAEKLDALNRQYKQKNKYIAANYDRIGIVTPKGTREYIKSLGMSANSYINGLIEADRRRREAAEDPEHNLQESRHEGPETKPQEAPQDTASGARTNSHEAQKSATEGRTEAQEGTTSDAPQPINPGDNLQDMLLYPYGTYDDIPPEELPFH